VKRGKSENENGTKDLVSTTSPQRIELADKERLF